MKKNRFNVFYLLTIILFIVSLVLLLFEFNQIIFYITIVIIPLIFLILSVILFRFNRKREFKDQKIKIEYIYLPIVYTIQLIISVVQILIFREFEVLTYFLTYFLAPILLIIGFDVLIILFSKKDIVIRENKIKFSFLYYLISFIYIAFLYFTVFLLVFHKLFS